MKVKMKTLAAWCKRAGYTGDMSDAEAMKQFLIAQGDKFKVQDSDGKDVDIKRLIVEQPDAETVVVRIAPEEEAESETPEEGASIPANQRAMRVDDIVAKTVAQVIEHLDVKGKREESQRPNYDDTPVSLKSLEEAWYEDLIKRKQAAFPNYAAAKTFAYHLHVQTLQGLATKRPDYKYVDPDGAIDSMTVSAKREHATKSMQQFTERVYGHAVKNINVDQKTYSGLTQAAGAAIIPDIFDSYIVRLVYDHSIARRVCRVVRMTSRTHYFGKATGNNTVYYPGETSSATASDLTWETLALEAKTGIVLTNMSNEIIADADVALADFTAREHAQRIGYNEDNTLFSGDGTGASGYIPGVRGIRNMIGLVAATDSRTSVGGGSALAHSIAHVMVAMGLAGRFTTTGPLAWYCSPAMAGFTLWRLAAALGGITMTEFQDRQLTAVGGYPIVLTEVMPTSTSAGTNRIDIVFGDLYNCATFGDRLAPEFAMSTERYFEQNVLSCRTTVRHAMNVHDVGSTTAAGPVSVLQQT